MSRAIVTTCCARKRRLPGLLPAAFRYQCDRINATQDRAKREKVTFRILSGRFGLIAGDEEIPFYDQSLTSEGVDELLDQVKKQLAADEVDSVEFVARSRDTEGWAPYYELIERACEESDIELTVQPYEAAPVESI